MTAPPDSAVTDSPLDHSGLAARRVVVALVLGVITAALAVAVGATWSVAALGVEDAAAAVFVIWVWATIAGADAAATARTAGAEAAARPSPEEVVWGII